MLSFLSSDLISIEIDLLDKNVIIITHRKQHTFTS